MENNRHAYEILEFFWQREHQEMSLPCLSLQVGKNYVVMIIIYYLELLLFKCSLFLASFGTLAPSHCAYTFGSQMMPELVGTEKLMMIINYYN